MAHLRVLRAGLGATIQDGGRRSYRRYGVTPAGPMDWAAFRTANLAIGNPFDAAAIEIGLGGLEIACEGAAVPIACCGGAFVWTCDKRQLGASFRLTLSPGERLAARPGAAGAFAYLAVAGGIATLPVLGSRATHLRAHLGGVEGRMLQEGDLLPLSASAFPAQTEAQIAAPWLAQDHDDFGAGRSKSVSPAAPDGRPLRVILGPQDDFFGPEALEAFFAGEFRLTHAADRMAYRLEGPRIMHARDFNIVSDGIAMGAIQIAGDGQPLVLMAEHQPTGGYPKLGHVARADIFRLAQLRPGDSCRFVGVDVETARAALLACEREVSQTASYLRPRRRTPSAEDLLRINLISGVVSRTHRAP